MHIHIQLYYLMRGNGNVHLIKTTTYIIAKLSWQLNSMKLSWLTTVTDGLIVSEQLFPEPPLFLSVMMGTGVVLERLVSSAFNHLMQLLAQGSFTGIKKKKTIFMKSKGAYYHVQDAYYWTLHCASSKQFTIHNWCSYCCFMVFCSAFHMVISLHIPQLCSAQLSNATHPIRFTLNHTLLRSLTAVTHLL